jgi:hypothetical protein
MERVCSLARRFERRHSPSALFVGAICLLAFVAISCLIKVAFDGLRVDYLESLRKEREVREVNIRLKAEQSALTQLRLLAMRAEKLGLKKPREEEVLSVR